MARPVHILAAGLILAFAAASARADGVTGYVEGNYAHLDGDSTDFAGANHTQTSDLFLQRYRLNLDRSFFPTLRLDAGGVFERTFGAEETDGVRNGFGANTTSVFSTLQLTLPTITAALGYNRRDFASRGTNFINEEPAFILTWRPLLLPTFSLRLSHPMNYDGTRQRANLYSNEAAFTAVWTPVRHLDLSYSYLYSNPHDQISHTETTSTAHSATALYGNTFLEGRSAVTAGVTASHRTTEIESAGTGTLTTAVPVTGGLSLVESLVATRELDTLQPNGALVNGDLTSSAGIDLGFSLSLAGDTHYRDLGVQLADAATDVTTFYVWVDRTLSDNVPEGIPFTAWRSDDNLHWLEVPVTSQLFSPFFNRFEITIPVTRARYFKVVAQPVAASVSTKDVYRDIFVTELQVLDIVPVTGAKQLQVTNGVVVNAGARTQLIRNLLAHDISLYLNHQVRPGFGEQTTWVLLNGLGLNRQLTDILNFSARVARQDADQLRGHEWQYLYGASLNLTELPTLTHALVYSGNVIQNDQGRSNINSFSLFNQATPYRGIGLIAAASYSIGGIPNGQTSEATTLNFGTTLQPNPKITLGASFTHSSTVATGAGLPRTAFSANQVDATATFNPVRVLLLSAGVTRIVSRPHPITLANGSVGFNPFPGGDLQVGANYTQSLQSDGSVTRFVSPYARWNIRPGTLLTVNYTLLDTDQESAHQSSRTLNVNLRIPL